MRITMSDNLQYLKGGWRVRCGVPRHLQAIIGKQVLTRHTGIFGLRDDKRKQNEARAAAYPIITQLKAEIALHETRDPQVVAAGILVRSCQPWGLMGISHLPAELQQPVRQIIQSEYDRRDTEGQEIARLEAEILKLIGNNRDRLIEYRDRLQSPGPVSESRGGTHYEDIIKLWENERVAEGKPPSDKAIQAKLTPLKLLFDWLHEKYGFQGGNMASVTAMMLHGYRDHLLAKKQPNLREHLFTIKFLFKIAEPRLPHGDPAEKLRVPRKPPRTKRLPFTPQEARTILLSARQSDNPIIRWFHPIACFTGTIPDEIIKMKKSEFRQVGDRWIWDFSKRPITQAKTPYRPRAIPLHAALIELGFVDFVMASNGKIFDTSPTIASNKLMKHIRRLGIENEADEDGNVTGDKVFYSWRHRFISELEDLTTADRSRFLAGHAGKDIHAENYLHHEMPKLIEAIDGLKNPI